MWRFSENITRCDERRERLSFDISVVLESIKCNAGYDDYKRPWSVSNIPKSPSICNVLILLPLSNFSMLTMKGDAESDYHAESDYGTSFLWEVLITIVAGLSLMVITWALKKYVGCHCTESLDVDEHPLPNQPPRPASPAVHDIDGPTKESV